ncbi:maleylpyruvate isomerase family mycothiol-dependent enzyme [Streptomyces sp. NPDC059063]|uniref:maleylpyruvate isomerase family mycothiol-dependent enzyme n=1 Tax=unclassified Streptomyces TaxID=2593676 RepID=UPI0036756CF6
MTYLTFDRYAAEIVAQTDQLRNHIKDADLAAPVPSCPGWSLGDLVRHVAGAHAWTEEIVRTRATGPVAHDQVDDVAGDDKADAAALGDWLADGAGRLADTLRDAGPDTPVWTVAPGGTPLFWARRMMFESVLHRADAVTAVGGTYTLDTDVALDGLDEWMWLTGLPQAYASPEAQRALLGPGRTIHLHATDADPATAGEWVVDLTGDTITTRHAHEKATVAARGSAPALLLLLYKRQSVLADDVELIGDRELFEEWREAGSYWLRK